MITGDRVFVLKFYCPVFPAFSWVSDGMQQLVKLLTCRHLVPTEPGCFIEWSTSIFLQGYYYFTFEKSFSKIPESICTMFERKTFIDNRF